jgi:hypothetical protein
MVHRDIKPANILLTRAGEAVLADFGIAHIVGATRHTASGALMGTLRYVAPEQGLEGQSDRRSDLYSLGIVCYEMLTGQTPFEAETPLALLMRHRTDPVPALGELDPSIPEALNQIVLKALAKHPDDRYQTAEEMASALQVMVAETGLELPTRVSVPASDPTREPAAGPPAVISGAVREAFAESDLLADTTSPGNGDRAADAMAPASRDRVRRAVLRAVGLVVLGNVAAATVAALTDRWPVFATGWPVELLLLGTALCMVMAATSCIWLLAPAGILLGNGLLLSYTVLADRWGQWRFLWPLDVWLALSLIAVTVWLARREDRSRRLSRWLGKALGWIAGAWTVVIAFVATLV